MNHVKRMWGYEAITKIHGITVPGNVGLLVSCLLVRQHAICLCCRSCRSGALCVLAREMIKTVVFCDVKQCTLIVVYPTFFRRTCCNCVQGGSIVHVREATLRIVHKCSLYRSSTGAASSLKMEAESSSETED
jgi:hypothetical protein